MTDPIHNPKRTDAGGVEFSVSGMKCAGCEQAITSALQKHQAVESVDARAAEGTVRIKLCGEVDRKELSQQIEAAGFGVSPAR